MTSDCIPLDTDGPHCLDKNAWWNMISSVYNFLSASTALAQALDQKYKNTTHSCTHFAPSKPLALEGIEDEVSLEEYPFFMELLIGTPDLSEVSPDNVQVAREEVIDRCNDKEETKTQMVECIENVRAESSDIPMTATIIKPGCIGDYQVVERALTRMHQHENSINESFERRQESIYYELAKTSKYTMDLDSLSEFEASSTGKATDKIFDDFTMKDTECETMANISEGSCFSLYSDSDHTVHSVTLPPLTEPQLTPPLTINEPLDQQSNKPVISFNGNTPESFPESRIDITPPPTPLDKNGKGFVTWLTANTSYTKEPSLNSVSPFMKSEEIQTTTNRRFNGILKAQITKAVGLEKFKNEENHDVTEAIDELVPKNVEELQRQLAFIRFFREHGGNKKDISVHAKQISKLVAELEKDNVAIDRSKGVVNEVDKIKTQSRKKPAVPLDAPKIQTTVKKTVPINGSADSLTKLLNSALSSKERFENNKLAVSKQLKTKLSNLKSKNKDAKREVTKIAASKENKILKNSTNSIQTPFPSLLKIVNKSAAQTYDRLQMYRSDNNKKNNPTTSKNERSGFGVRPTSRKKSSERKLSKTNAKPMSPDSSKKNCKPLNVVSIKRNSTTK